MKHTWRFKKYLTDRFGQKCKTCGIRGKNGNILVAFEDGYKVVTSRFAVRKLKDGE